jgi:hypothetical protein
MLPGEDALDVRLLVDRPIAEVFINGGRFAWSADIDYWSRGAAVPPEIAQYSPARSSIHFYQAAGASGAVAVRNVSLYGMACGWVGA